MGFGIVSTTLEVKGMEPEEMDPEDYSKFEIKSKIRIGGVIVVERVELNKEELGADTRRCIARADFINQDIPKMDTRVRPQVVFTAWETRSSQRPRVSKTTENSHQQPSNLRPVSTDPLHGDSIDSTWTMEKLTKSMNNSDLPWPRAPGRINRTARTPIYQIVGNILPQELLSRRNPMPQGSNDEETIDHGISDQETSDQETSDQEISDQEIRDQETRDQEIRDQETGYHESSDRETSDHDAESQSPRSTQMTKSD
ncbi:hypothetical protein BGZ76_003861 [Entomortierella beljakovae]|nr:hypothetical protein BGZ76_003861 [Entomortierella beljakovae]